MYIDDNVIFVHNPRAAGTSVRRALLHGKSPNENIPWPGSLPGPNTSNMKHMFARQLRSYVGRGIWDSRIKIAIVRNPWDRVVSLYGLFRRPTEDAFRKRSEHAKLPIKLDKFLDSLDPDKIEGLTKGLQRRLAQHAFNMSFKEWLLDFCEEYKWNACRYLDTYLPMTRILQSEWFEGLDGIFKFEDLQVLSDWLVSHDYVKLDKENETRHKAWQTYYDNETYDFVAKAHASDINRFGY